MRLFCSQGCLMEFVNKHHREMIALEPRFEALETPILNPTKNTTSYWDTWKIEVDNTRTNDIG